MAEEITFSRGDFDTAGEVFKSLLETFLRVEDQGLLELYDFKTDLVTKDYGNLRITVERI